MNQYIQFVCALTLGLAAMSWLLRIAIDSLFTDWDPVRHYRRYLSGIIEEKMQADADNAARQRALGKRIPS